jgi:hypothetical protein
MLHMLHTRELLDQEAQKSVCLAVAGYSQHAENLHWSHCCKMQYVLTSIYLLSAFIYLNTAGIVSQKE